MFDATYVVNLDRRPDRMERFTRDLNASGWPFGFPERILAIDGKLIPKPSGYDMQPGSWGHVRTFLRLLEDAMNTGLESIFIFEDDCVFTPDFGEKIMPFLDAVPSDWDMIYLGGVYRAAQTFKPEKINDLVYQIAGCTGTWAVAFSRHAMEAVYKEVCDYIVQEVWHFDSLTCRCQAKEHLKVYVPNPWLCGHAEGQSDICPRNYAKVNYWNFSPEEPPVVFAATHLLSRVRTRGGHQIDDGAFGEPYLATTAHRKQSQQESL